MNAPSMVPEALQFMAAITRRLRIQQRLRDRVAVATDCILRRLAPAD